MPPALRYKKSPVSLETGDFPYQLFTPIRRGRRSLRSDFHTPSGYQRPVGRFQLALRLAESLRPELAPALPGDRSGGFARVASSTNHQVRIPYAERKLATGRAVLLDCHQAQPTRPEFVSGDSPPNNKRTTRGEGGPFIRSRRGEPGSVGRGNIIRALRTRHRHYNKQSKFRQSLESKKMNRFQNIIWRKKQEKYNKSRPLENPFSCPLINEGGWPKAGGSLKICTANLQKSPLFREKWAPPPTSLCSATSP